ncbi:MAG: glycosyltransferase [Pyrinomonadaceae bacterium]|nr:glycosyltransferase [Pyrinomonadaceae bacterium]
MTNSVLIVGASGASTLESSYARAFSRLNWRVQFWNPAESLEKNARGSRFGRIFSRLVHVEPWLRKANLDLIQMCDELRPALLLIITTEGVRGGTLAQIKALAPDILIYCVFPDTPHNLTADRIHCLPFFDRTAVGSPAWVDAFERLGATRVHYLPFAADTDYHRPVDAANGKASKRHDVAFIGIWRPQREELLEQLAVFDLRVYGSDYWRTHTRPGSPVRAHWAGRTALGAEFATVCASSRIMLNIIDAVGWPGPNMRAFEQPACRAFSLVTRTPAILSHFTEGETVECYGSIEEARDKIVFYLKNETARRRIADASYRFVVEGGHTYLDRARQLLQWAKEDGISLDGE